MKARVKATGEIVNVTQIGTKCYLYDLNNVEILDGPDYWEKLKHKYAGMAMQGIMANEETQLDLHAAFGKEESLDVMIADFAILIANTLVEKLKNEKL